MQAGCNNKSNVLQATVTPLVMRLLWTLLVQTPASLFCANAGSSTHQRSEDISREMPDLYRCGIEPKKG